MSSDFLARWQAVLERQAEIKKRMIRSRFDVAIVGRKYAPLDARQCPDGRRVDPAGNTDLVRLDGYTFRLGANLETIELAKQYVSRQLQCSDFAAYHYIEALPVQDLQWEIWGR